MSIWKKKSKSTVVSLAKPEEKPKRTLDEIQSIYSALASKAGQAWYHRECLTGDLETLNRQMRELNQEAAILKQAEAAAKAAETPPSTEGTQSPESN